MGYYIQVPDNKGKAQQLVTIHGAEILPGQPASFGDVPEDKALICVVDNGPFEAAALCYDEREFGAFAVPDEVSLPDVEQMPSGIKVNLQSSYQREGQQRPRTWLLMSKSLAHELAGCEVRG